MYNRLFHQESMTTALDGIDVPTTFNPVIKWTGSKRNCAKEIVSHFPPEIDTYYEPFVGGGSVIRRLLSSDVVVNKYCCSDLNSDLINLWNAIKQTPDRCAEVYKSLWTEHNKDDNVDRQRSHFEEIRSRLNAEHSPYDFLFILRTTSNGLVRYNASGEFNNSMHIHRPGINPSELKSIIFDWSYLLNKHDVQFVCCDYKTIATNSEDYIFADPPYAGTKGIYFGTINYEDFWDWLRSQNAQYAFTFDGKSNYEDYTYAVPANVYSKHLYLSAANSSFRRLYGNNSTSYISESLYLK